MHYLNSPVATIEVLLLSSKVCDVSCATLVLGNTHVGH